MKILNSALFPICLLLAASLCAQETTTQTPLDPKVAYENRVAKIQEQTEGLWGHALGMPVIPRQLDDAELSATLKRLLKEEMEKPGALASLHLMTLLGIVPEGTDLAALYQSLLEGQVGGLYVPSEKALYVVKSFDPNGFIGGIILSHEITHALQDSKYDLAEYLENVTVLDRQKARQAVVEGDATVLMGEWGAENFSPAVFLELGSMFDKQLKDLEAMPAALVQDMVFPYLGGSKFCTAVMAQYRSNWREKLYTDPPSSTEQILHPTKYLSEPRDEPREVTLGDAPSGFAYQEIYRNTVGEWLIRLMLTPRDKFPKFSMLNLDPIVKEPVATKAAAGWGGDLVVLLTRDGAEQAADYAIAWRTEWDTEADAVEFAETLKAHWDARNPTYLEIVRSVDRVEVLLASDDEGRAAALHVLGQSAKAE